MLDRLKQTIMDTSRQELIGAQQPLQRFEKINMQRSSLLQSVNRKKIYNTLWNVYKSSYQFVRFSATAPKTILFILGCQRSGTTLMTDIFQRDLTTKVYQEHSRLSAQDPRKLRLNPLPQVKEMLSKDRAQLVVLKPLVETQNTDKLLAYFAQSKVLWMYRHYQDVAASKLKKSGLHNGIRDMTYIVERNHSWRAENVPEHIRQTIVQLYDPNMNPYDAAALYWYVRNSFLFELNLDQNVRVMLCKYEEFVKNPLANMQQIYKFVGCPIPAHANLADVYATSIGKGAKSPISPAVAALCDEMLEKLDALWLKSQQ